MTAGRLVLLLVVLGVAFYLYKHSASSMTPAPSQDGSSSSPIDRARDAARRSRDRSDQTESVKREADLASGQITENMTPEQVRALLGPPTEVESEPTDAGGRRETWTYRQVGKTVVFENGVVIAVR